MPKITFEKNDKFRFKGGHGIVLAEGVALLIEGEGGT